MRNIFKILLITSCTPTEHTWLKISRLVWKLLELKVLILASEVLASFWLLCFWLKQESIQLIDNRSIYIFVNLNTPTLWDTCIVTYWQTELYRISIHKKLTENIFNISGFRFLLASKVKFDLGGLHHHKIEHDHGVINELMQI